MTVDSGDEDAGRSGYLDRRRRHWDAVARSLSGKGAPRAPAAYHRRLADVYRFLVPAGSKVIELGCGDGDLLAALSPAVGVGVDLSPEMVARGRERHPSLRFEQAAIEDYTPGETFDVVILSDIVNELWDAQSALERVRELCRPETRVILNVFSRLWQVPLRVARRAGFARPLLEQNWFAPDDLENLLYLTGFETIRRWTEVLWPVATPLWDGLANRFLVRWWPFRWMGLTNFLLARLQPAPRAALRAPRVSVVVPARNEAGNIGAILRRTPEMGAGTELIFVEGHSRDDTWGEIERQTAGRPGCLALRQTGQGKGDAVRAGFAVATGDVLMILDADLTVPPEDLPRFLEALTAGRGEFANGVRLVYPMEKRAMRFFNLVANKAFGLAFSWVLGQKIKDTLCGTKVMWKYDYERLAAQRGYFGDFDPFGDFDLLFGAARLNLRIVDVPVRYRERTYGTTNIRRWREGWMLLRMLAFAARRLKFS